MTKKGIEVNQVSYSIIINYYYKSENYNKCWEIFEVAKKKGMVDLITYTTMIRICRFQYKYNKSRALFKEASELFQLNTSPIYNAHISTLSTNKITSEEALSVWKLMKSKGVTPDEFTFEFVMKAFSNLGKVDDAEQLLKEMDVYKIPNNNEICRYLIATYATAASNDKRISTEKKNYEDKAFKYLEQLKKENIKMSTFSFNSLLNLLINLKGIDEAKKQVFQMMHEYGLKTNMQTYMIIIKEYIENENYAKALEVFIDFYKTRKYDLTNRIIGFAFIAAMMTNNSAQLLSLYDTARTLRITPLISILIALKDMDNKVSNNLLNGLNKYFPVINVSISIGDPNKNIEDLINLSKPK